MMAVVRMATLVGLAGLGVAFTAFGFMEAERGYMVAGCVCEFIALLYAVLFIE